MAFGKGKIQYRKYLDLWYYDLEKLLAGFSTTAKVLELQSKL
jgi:hypothetical protein